MQDAIEAILQAYGVLDEFIALEGLAESEALWHIEILPQGKTWLVTSVLCMILLLSCQPYYDSPLTSNPPRSPPIASSTFSQPLVIARISNTVILAHYSTETWDVVYDPLMEYNVTLKKWTPLCLQRHYEGHFKVADGGISLEEAQKFGREWAARLIERGYHDIAVGQLRRVATSRHSTVPSKL
ncbi:hypothetical protein SeLEV6574_g01151 [Synchytrium endobioticum]|uniref:Uncharacterized protein n=1 Tax=Synchytrium endobioticum TaxID=286115 RepID=A0A507DEL7_9FUNG|nr:hypothetical protein SeLEV6574_g01151 [Synchytrium endobioticum]